MKRKSCEILEIYFNFLTHNLADLLKISEKYGCADTGAISQWPAHENHDTASYTAEYLAGVVTTLSDMLDLTVVSYICLI